MPAWGPAGAGALLALGLLGCGCGGCGGGATATGGAAATEGPGEPGAASASEAADRPASCPAQAEAPSPLPNVRPEHRRLGYWLERVQAQQGDPDEILLTPSEIADHGHALERPHEDGRPIGQRDLLAEPDRELLATELEERLAYLHDRLAEGEYVDEDGERLEDGALEVFEPPGSLPKLVDRLHVATGSIPLRCGPRVEGFYTPSLDLAFDRNNCSTIHPQEPVQVLAEWPEGMLWAQTPYAMGWIDADAPLSPAVPAERRKAVAHGPRAQADGKLVLRAEGGAEAEVPDGTLLPLAGDGEKRVLFATGEGIHEATVAPGEVVPTERPLTRRAVLEEAFALLGTPYGWGGHRGGRDCSRFLLDVFARFGLELPRHSGRQALAGTFAIDVADVEDEKEKRLLIESAAKKGIVLLHFPGHIMLYLGRTEQGRPMAIHAFAEYVTPCEGTEGPDGAPLETLHRVDEVTVSDLELGRGSSRTAFIERITQIVVIGDAPGVELGGVAEPRPAAEPAWDPDDAERACDDSLEVAIFHSPKMPHRDAPLRVIATSSHDPRPVALTLIDPDGTRHEPKATQLGGPPWTLWASLESPKPGRWTALLADGARVEACERFTVYPGFEPPPSERPASGEAPAWESRWSWEEDTENLYSAFVENLFTEPKDEDVTWPALQEVLEDPARNLLHDHFGRDEDERLHLEPDCADLPYFLRTYFAWKTQLPVGFRRCTRGRAGRPPACGEELYTNLEPVKGDDPVEAFRRFLRLVKSGVHSGSARTHPEADNTDLYPVALTREALRPGTVFADPYGHLLVVAAWRPQTKKDYGVLVGADAQPDGTVGRRRFWRGSFLFDPDTTNAGAGFKRWRPLVYDRREEQIVALDNEALRQTEEHVPMSLAQYEGTADDFYERMEALINPRPLDATDVQQSLVDALDEAVARRVNSVNNAVEFMEERGWAPIEMPTGYDIFETSGAWENYSTPARDMRLLISIDAVVKFPEVVSRSPERFGVEPDEVDDAAAELRKKLREELERREFQYTRSDGSAWTLTLKDVVDRAEAFEMSYHPNDCVEIRWAAPEGSDERSTCDRHAPAAHKARMRRYREWFEQRQRPPRGT